MLTFALLVIVQRTSGIAESIVAALISGGISAGTSLAGTTAAALLNKQFNVAAGGSIENFSKWTMILDYCTAEQGYIDKPMINVRPGKKEGFASHKTGNTATGTYVYCRYKVKGNALRLHIMYSAPYSFDMHSNWLGLAITTPNVQLDADKMYYGTYSYVALEEFYNSVRPAKICSHGFCVSGTMGTSHHPEIHVKFYPEEFKDLGFPIKQALKDKPYKRREYARFIRAQFKM